MAPTEIVIDRSIGQERGEISSSMVKKQLAAANGSPITCRIHSDGGSVFEGLAIFDAFAAYPGPKRCIVESSAFSMASVVAMAFSVREITSNGFLMVHNPESTDGTELPVLEKLRQRMAAIYAQTTRQPIASITRLMAAETFLDASESLRLGFVTSIAPMTQRAVAAFQSSLRGNKNFHAAIVARLRNETATAKGEWTSKVKAAYAQTGNAAKAICQVDRTNPGLRQRFIQEANKERSRG